MPDPGHAAHDPLLVAAHAAGDASGAELARAAGLVASCPECARLHRDLRALSAALASAPAPARPRDFRLTDAQAAALRRPAGPRAALARLLAPLSGARSAAGPLAASLAALGLAGLLLGTGLRLPLGAGSAARAPEAAASAAGRDSVNPVDNAAGGSEFGLSSAAPQSQPAASPAWSGASAPAGSPTTGPTQALGPNKPLDRVAAVAIARAASPRYAKEQVLDARLGTFDELRIPGANVAGPTPSAHDRVWLVRLGWLIGPLDGQGVVVIIGVGDGRVIQIVDWVA